MMLEKERLTINDFIAGILAALVLARVTTISRQGTCLDAVFAKVFSEDLGEQVELHSLDIRFRIRQHRIHEDSPELYTAILSAAQRGLVIFTGSGGSDMRIQISESWAQEILSELPGSPEMYRGLAAKFVEYYEASPLTRPAIHQPVGADDLTMTR